MFFPLQEKNLIKGVIFAIGTAYGCRDGKKPSPNKGVPWYNGSSNDNTMKQFPHRGKRKSDNCYPYRIILCSIFIKIIIKYGIIFYIQGMGIQFVFRSRSITILPLSWETRTLIPISCVLVHYVTPRSQNIGMDSLEGKHDVKYAM